MGLVHSTQRGPVKSVPVADDESDEVWADWITCDQLPELLNCEELLPDPLLDDCLPDEYESQWDHNYGWSSRVDDAPRWEKEVLLPCTQCGDEDDLDPLGTCADCREADRRCSWCGLDPIVYESDGACRTCYQRLRRDRVTTGIALRLSMLDAAFRRADLRKRRKAADND